MFAIKSAISCSNLQSQPCACSAKKAVMLMMKKWMTASSTFALTFASNLKLEKRAKSLGLGVSSSQEAQGTLMIA